MDLRGRAQQPDPPPSVYLEHLSPQAVEWRTGTTATQRMLRGQHAVRPGAKWSVCKEHLVERLTVREPVGLTPCPGCLRKVLSWGLSGPQRS